MPFQRPDQFTVRRVDKIRWQLCHALQYQGKRQSFLIPAGYVTDFATVPWFVQWFIPRTGVWTLAAVLHDWLITHGIPAGLITSSDCDGLFRRVLREEGTDVLRRWLMWTGVRWGALSSATRRPGWLNWRDTPAVLVISAGVLAPFVLLVVWLLNR